MCINPIYIHNKRGDYHPLYHKRLILVPCGKCEECRQNRQHEIMTRLSCHAFENHQNGGKYLFLTFTYNDSHLPHLYFKGVSQPCFNWDDVLTLIKWLRKQYNSGDWSYFGVCEYGKHTKRPHYHISFWISPNIDDVEFAENCRKFWTKQPYKYNKHTRTWSTTCNGFMFPSKSDVQCGKHLVRSKTGVSYYAAKYTCKDIGFYSIPIIKEIDENPILREKYKRCLPHVFQSINLGYTYLSNILDENPAAVKFTNPLTGKPCLLPKYAIDKKSYNTYKGDELNKKNQRKTIRELNEFGVTRRMQLLPELILIKAQQYENLNDPRIHSLRNSVTDLCLKMSIYHYVYANLPFEVLHSWYNEYISNCDVPFLPLSHYIYDGNFVNYLYKHMTLDRLDLSSVLPITETYYQFNTKTYSYDEKQLSLTSDQSAYILRKNYISQCRLTAQYINLQLAEIHDNIESELFTQHINDVLQTDYDNELAEELYYFTNPYADQQIGTDDNITI